MTRFVLVTHGSRGDVDPFVAIGAELLRLGHEVTVLTHGLYGSAVREVGADFIAVDEVADYEFHLRRTRALIETSRPMADYYGDSGLFLDRVSVTGGFDQIRREVRSILGLRDDLVIVGRLTSALSGLIAAEITGSPVCLVSLSPFQLITAPVTGLHLARAASGQVNDIRAEFGLPAVERWSQWLLGANLTIGMWPRWFDEAGKASPADVMLTDFVVRPGNGARRRSTGDEIPELRDGVILVTGGTGRMLNDRFYPAAIAGLRDAGRPGIVVTPHTDLLPSSLPDGVVHRPALSFAEVMPRVAGVVHHGGIGTLALALASGTPQLLLADGGDRADNARRLEGLGLAGYLSPDDWSAAAVGGRIAQLGEPRHARNRAPVGGSPGEASAAKLLSDRLAGPATGLRREPSARGSIQ